MVRINALNIYPVKSCRGIALQRVRLTPAGLDFDRNWMVIDQDACFVTQRELPRLALVGTAFRDGHLELSALGMPDLAIPLDTAAGARRRVQVWDHVCPALDEGELPAQWLSAYLGGVYRLVRFDPAHRRLSSSQWTGADEALNRFTDGYPILVISQGSLDDLNRRLAVPLPMSRFRPNIVIDGVEPYDEDHIDTLSAGDVRLRIVKPCTRCEITTTDQESGGRGVEPLQTLATYRANARLQGGITFGQNAIVIAGAGKILEVGMTFQEAWAF
jgi:hypothetical protein